MIFLFFFFLLLTKCFLLYISGTFRVRALYAFNIFRLLIKKEFLEWNIHFVIFFINLVCFGHEIGWEMKWICSLCVGIMCTFIDANHTLWLMSIFIIISVFEWDLYVPWLLILDSLKKKKEQKSLYALDLWSNWFLVSCFQGLFMRHMVLDCL